MDEGILMKGKYLAEEIWGRIMEAGVSSSLFTHRDLCSLAIVSRSFRRLSSLDSLWSHLLIHCLPSSSSLFPPSSSNSSSDSPSSSLNDAGLSLKLVYKSRFEKEKARRVSAHRRALLTLESEIAVRSKTLQRLRLVVANEQNRLKSTMVQSANLQRIRQASVALNVWQPEVIRDRQRRLVEQCSVPIDARLKDLEMDMRVCGKQIEVACKAYKEEKKRIDASMERLKSLKYHPLRYIETEREISDFHVHKKLKTSCESEEKRIWMSSRRQAIALEKVRRSVLKLFEGKFLWKEVCNTTFVVEY